MLEKSLELVSMRILELKSLVDILLSEKVCNHRKLRNVSDLLEFNENLMKSLISPIIKRNYIQ